MTAPAEDHAGVIALPPLIFLAAIVVAVLLQWLVPFSIRVPTVLRWIAAAVIVACVALAAWGRVTFTRAGTNVNPTLPSTTIVDGGPYRFTRNPMYLAMSVALLSLGLALASAWYLVMLVPAFALIHRGVVLREERYLTAKFGTSYQAYRNRVRRYL